MTSVSLNRINCALLAMLSIHSFTAAQTSPASTMWDAASRTSGSRAFIQSVSPTPKTSAAGQSSAASDEYAVFRFEFVSTQKRESFHHQNVTPFFAHDRWETVFIPVDAYDQTRNELLNEPDIGLKWVEPPSIVSPPPPAEKIRSKEKPRGAPDAIIRGGLDGLSGKGVIIAIIDTGIDFHHRDFQTIAADGTPSSRILYFWDTTAGTTQSPKLGKPGPLRFPNGAPIGMLYSRDDLNSELRTSEPQFESPDPGGHGTACAGIAAGNGGRNKDNIGVAPEADLICVKIGDSDGDLVGVYLFNAIVKWLDEVAGPRPMVISCSFGTQWGGHDGALLVERCLDSQLPQTRKGRAICIAAGNEGADRIHARLDLSADDPEKELVWDAGSADDFPEVWIYPFTANENDIGIRRPESIRIDRNYVHGITGQRVLMLKSQTRSSRVSIRNLSNHPIRIDAYLLGTGTFDESCAAPDTLIGSPGSSSNAITVGSYDWNDRFKNSTGVVTLLTAASKAMNIGSISYYSSPGYSRLGDTVKPDLVAPGQWFSAPLSSQYRVSDSDLAFDGYWPFNGTSAATPYTAGVIALMFEKNPNLSTIEIKKLLQSHLTKDRFTGNLPNNRWGNGKLTAKAVRETIADISK